jgi:hypothetical protein
VDERAGEMVACERPGMERGFGGALGGR